MLISPRVSRRKEFYLIWIRAGVVGYRATPFELMVSDFFKVRTAFPSINHVKVSGCQSICMMSGLKRSFGSWGERRTHSVVVVVAEGITEIPMLPTVGLFGYRRG